MNICKNYIIYLPQLGLKFGYTYNKDLTTAFKSELK